MNLREAVANLIKVKGRHNTEIAYQKLIEAFDADEPEAEVCCQEFDKCLRSCTPRGQWIAHVLCGCGDQIMPDDGAECGTCVTARNAVKPEPEPVACDCDSPAWCKQYKKCHRAMLGFEPYVAPPQREWQELTEEEIKHLWYEACQTNLELTSQLIVHLARNIEAKLKEKNT